MFDSGVRWMHVRAVLLAMSLFSPVASVRAQEGTERTLRLSEQAYAAAPFAPGVLTVIRPDPELEETFSGPHELSDVVHGIPNLKWTPHFEPDSRTLLEMARLVVYRRSIWNLEFAFKPMRMIYVDVPQPDGTMQRKLVWYLVYRVKNNGYHLRPAPQKDDFGNETYQSSYVNHTIRFFPQFLLEDHQRNIVHLDQIIPAALQPIKEKEFPGNRLHDSVSISTLDIPISTDRVDRSVWGVTTWIGVDPRTDFFSVFVKGLTNAYRFEEQPERVQEDSHPGVGRKYWAKTLQLNFWRRGDAIDLHEKEIRYGAPGTSDPIPEQTVFELYDIKKRLDYQWVYR